MRSVMPYGASMSSVGGCQVEARSASEIVSSASRTVTRMSLLPSSKAAVSPIGPAPAMMMLGWFMFSVFQT